MACLVLHTAVEEALRLRFIAWRITPTMLAWTMCSVSPQRMRWLSLGGHVFNDANKRTGLTCALTYLEKQDVRISRQPELEDLMVDVASGIVTAEELAEYFSAVWELSGAR